MKLGEVGPIEVFGELGGSGAGEPDEGGQELDRRLRWLRLVAQSATVDGAIEVSAATGLTRDSGRAWRLRRAYCFMDVRTASAPTQAIWSLTMGCASAADAVDHWICGRTFVMRTSGVVPGDWEIGLDRLYVNPYIWLKMSVTGTGIAPWGGMWLGYQIVPINPLVYTENLMPLV